MKKKNRLKSTKLLLKKKKTYIMLLIPMPRSISIPCTVAIFNYRPSVGETMQSEITVADANAEYEVDTWNAEVVTSKKDVDDSHRCWLTSD